jgi:hypothetical protein
MTLAIASGRRRMSCVKWNSAASAVTRMSAVSTGEHISVRPAEPAPARRRRACSTISGDCSMPTMRPFAQRVGGTARGRRRDRALGARRCVLAWHHRTRSPSGPTSSSRRCGAAASTKSGNVASSDSGRGRVPAGPWMCPASGGAQHISRSYSGFMQFAGVIGCVQKMPSSLMRAKALVTKIRRGLAGSRPCDLPSLPTASCAHTPGSRAGSDVSRPSA